MLPAHFLIIPCTGYSGSEYKWEMVWENHAGSRVDIVSSMTSNSISAREKTSGVIPMHLKTILIRIRIGLSGKIDRDSIRLSESIDWIREDFVPWDWVACIKKFDLAYRSDGAYEYMEGTWSGISKDDPNEDCIPGKVILSRTIEGLNKFLEQRRDSVINTIALNPEPAAPVLADYNSKFLDTEPKKVTEIDVYNADLQIQLLDYMKPDNDTVSVYLNREVLAKNIQISKRPALIKFRIDKRIVLHELLLYAENLGLIPPNTSELILIDGETKHRVMIVSDKQKTAAIYLRYKPAENKRRNSK
jgi:hypothetical protein